MPGWGTGSFENEYAQSFLDTLKSIGIDDLKAILARAADEDGYLEAPDSSIAIAAAEVIATLVASEKDASLKSEAVSSAAPRLVEDWIEKNKMMAAPHLEDLIDVARRAVDRVRTNSELKDLWLEAEGLNEWSASVRDLKQRLDK